MAKFIKDAEQATTESHVVNARLTGKSAELVASWTQAAGYRRNGDFLNQFILAIADQFESVRLKNGTLILQDGEPEPAAQTGFVLPTVPGASGEEGTSQEAGSTSGKEPPKPF